MRETSLPPEVVVLAQGEYLLHEAARKRGAREALLDAADALARLHAQAPSDRETLLSYVISAERQLRQQAAAVQDHEQQLLRQLRAEKATERSWTKRLWRWLRSWV